MEISKLRTSIEEGSYEVPVEEVAEAVMPWISPTGREPEKPADDDQEPPQPPEQP